MPREVVKGVDWVGAVDWNRRLFDSLIPLPDGTSYNAYLIRGSEKTAIIDAVDPAMWPVMRNKLTEVSKVDYIIAQHAEQDHSGAIPELLKMYPEAQLLCSDKGVALMASHLSISEDQWRVVKDGEELSLGDKMLKFIYTPWVHWPETISTYLKEDEILFTCDFFGSHYASSSLFSGTNPQVIDSAKRYYAELMMPFRKIISGHLEKLKPFSIKWIAPSHGPIHDHPELILEAYRDWISDRLSNEVVIPYISMHGSTELMVDHLMTRLSRGGVVVHKYELTSTDLGKLAMSLVDAATVVIGTPTVYTAPHPAVQYALHLTKVLRPKLKYAAVIGSYGWGTKVADHVRENLSSLKVEMLGAILAKGHPTAEIYSQLDALADQIVAKHALL